MRALLVLVLLLPGAQAWAVTVEAPERAGSGLPLVVSVCVDAPEGAAVELKLDLRLDGQRVGRVAGVPANRYAPAFAGCQDVEVETQDVEGAARLEAKARPEGGQAKARAAADVALVRAPVAVAADGRLVPVLDGPAPRLVLAEAWGAPFEGVVLRNAGDAPARLLHHRVGDAPLPDATIPPGGAAFVGARAPPDAPPWIDAPVQPGSAPVQLLAANRALAALEGLPPARGEWRDVEGAHRMGVPRVDASPLRVEGTLLAYATPAAGVAPVVAFLDAARDELLVEAYTLTSPEVGAAFLRALDRGVRVRMLLEGAPVGGMPEGEGALVAALVARGAEVAFLEGAREFPARYRTVHAKLLVADRERVLVATENLHASSYPAAPDGMGTRGFGLVVGNATLARRLAAMVEADLAPWPDVRAADLAALPPPAPEPPAAIGPGAPPFAIAGAWSVTPVVSPGDAAPLLDALSAARERVDVAMLLVDARFGDAPNPLVEALVEAARRGVAVRLLLDGRFDDGRNAQVAARLDALAAREALPLAARVDEPARTLHAKLVLVDGRAAYVGSMNWGRASVEDNREVGLLVQSEALARWLQKEFEKDWAPAPDAAAPREEAHAAGAGVVLVAALLSSRWCRRPRRPCPRASGRRRT